MNSLLTQTNKSFGLFIVYKGFPDIETMVEWHRHNTWPDYTSMMMADFGYDLTAYRLAAERVTNPTLVFFNSSSELTNENCIQNLVLGLKHFECCGCFGSYESFNTSFISRLLFPRFPNPHIRTNGFAISRKLFMRVWPRNFYTKLGCHLWESGKKGLGSKVLIGVANKHGYFQPHQFHRSGFRFDNDLLLCLDNRSREWTPEEAFITWVNSSKD